MKPENREFLDKYRYHYDTVINAGYVKHLNAHEREGMQRIMGEEFQPGYHADLWCAPCVFDMVKLLYQRYDAWIAAQPKEEPPVSSEPSAPSVPSETNQAKTTTNESNTSNSPHTPQRNHRRR